MTHWRDVERGDPEYRDLVVALVLVWGFCDAVSAMTAASFVGPGGELNPLVRGLLEGSPVALAGVKGAAALAAGILALAGERVVRTAPWWRRWLAGLVGIGVGATGLNLLAAYASLLPRVVAVTG